MHSFPTKNKQLLTQADDLLYHVLWQPFGLPRDTRDKFEINGEEVVFVTVREERVIAVFVLITRGIEAEIRHAAVHQEFHHLGIGRTLCEMVLEYAKAHGVRKIEVFGRNTAIAFWEKLGFQDKSDWLDHDLFIKYGIRFKKMVKAV
ncbi:MAG: GNAT family N-acetyltransferase [Eubacteriales bacterium]